MNPYKQRAHTAVAKYDKAGVDLPAEAVELLELRAAAEPLKGVPPLNIREAIESGAITKATIEKRLRAEAVTASQSHINNGYADEVSDVVDDLVTAACRRDLDRVVTQLRPRFDELAKVVADTLPHITAEAFGNPEKVLGDPVATGRFHELQAAMFELDTIADLIRHITPKPRYGEQFVHITTPFEVRAEAPTIQNLESAWRQGRAKWLALWSIEGIEPRLNDSAQLADTIGWFERRDAFTLAEAEKHRRHGQKRSAVSL